MEQMTAEQKIKHHILNIVRNDEFIPAGMVPVKITAANIDSIYDEVYENNELSDAMQEATYGMRDGEVETGLPCPQSRHYESYSVAAKMADGSWVGWTYWYGGGKHGEPEAIEWMEESYLLDCKEEEKLVVVRTFTRGDE